MLAELLLATVAEVMFVVLVVVVLVEEVVAVVVEVEAVLAVTGTPPVGVSSRWIFFAFGLLSCALRSLT